MIRVKKRNGRLEPLETNKINKCVERACEGLVDVSASEIVLDASLQLYDKVTSIEIDKALILSARAKIVKEPNYSLVAARLMLNTLYKDVFKEGVDSDGFEYQYRNSFIRNIKEMVKQGRLSPDMLKFDLKLLASKIKLDRDLLFKYLGIQTLYDRYLIHIDKKRLETPQAFWMRVAMGLSLNERDINEAAICFYEKISSFLYCPSTPTLFNSGTNNPQLSSCYLSTVEDSIDGIFGTIHNQARLSKYAGGLGVDWTPTRSTGSYIRGTNGESSGSIPWLKIFNDMLVAVNQGGKRKGAGCAYLEVWHLDIEDFIDLRKNTGDDRRRCHDMNTAVWVPDEFMRRVENNDIWYLFCPAECPGLHESYGPDFDNKYINRICQADRGELKNFRRIPAKDLWKKILTSLFETGHPWITFKDTSNLRYTNKHEGVVHSSNLCCEILLHTKPTLYNNGSIEKLGETAVCNLASINLKSHIENDELNWDKLSDTINIAIRGLDNVIDINFYPTAEAQNANLTHRPIGLGIMGFHDVLHELSISYNSDKSAELAGKLQEFIAYHAILASSRLASERGKYNSYQGSDWSKGKIPSDSTTRNVEYQLDWAGVRECIAKNGMRNSNVMAIAPTATISYIQGCSQSIEPDYSLLYVYSTLSGEFTMINEYFVRKMKESGLWCQELLDALIHADGDVSLLNLPDTIKDEFLTPFDIDYRCLVDAAANRQIWIDMGQSFNIYCNKNSLKYLSDIYFYCWKSGLKTTYYLRSKAASKIEKSVVETKACSIENPNCESCQ